MVQPKSAGPAESGAAREAQARRPSSTKPARAPVGKASFPHPATIQRTSAGQVGRPPHPATVQRARERSGGAAQPKGEGAPGSLPAKDNAVLRAARSFRRFNEQDLPDGGFSNWLRDVHFTYLSANRAEHTQLHITFTDSDEPEQERGRRHNAWLWFHADTGRWNWAGTAPNIRDADLEWYQRRALIWALGTENDYLATLPERVRPANQFTEHARLAQEQQDEIDEENDGEDDE